MSQRMPTHWFTLSKIIRTLVRKLIPVLRIKNKIVPNNMNLSVLSKQILQRVFPVSNLSAPFSSVLTLRVNLVVRSRPKLFLKLLLSVSSSQEKSLLIYKTFYTLDIGQDCTSEVQRCLALFELLSLVLKARVILGSATDETTLW